ncbi:BTB/POZ domain containing protein [Pseudohyphozyma bogoriensis]|nr:BTB/POZ domain containing protein [Pseudohyphozyma bogoriensis]
MSNAPSNVLAAALSSDPTSFDGNFTIISSDDVKFKVNPLFLAFHSTIFKDMFAALPSGDKQECRLTEPGNELEALFEAMRSSVSPPDIDALGKLVGLSDKYNCRVVREAISPELFKQAENYPLQSFSIASQLGKEDLLQRAAYRSLGYDWSSSDAWMMLTKEESTRLW